MKAKYFWIGSLSTLLVLSMIWLGARVVKNVNDLITESAQARGESSSTVKNLEDWFDRKVSDIDKQLDRNYINEIDKQKMYEEAVKGYVNALGDPYTVYLTQEEYRAFQQDLSATYDGIGAPIEKDKDTNALTIIAPYKDSPADKAGLRTGDIILKVDGESILELDATEVARRIRGQKGTTVTLTIQRKVVSKVEMLDIPIVRDTIQIPTIEAKILEDNIGYIAIFGFDEPTADQFKNELNKLRKQQIKGLVIDLRGNPGGYLISATEIADEILFKGLVVYTEDKAGARESFDAITPAYLDIPIAVLVDSGSASASEILAGALKDHKLATIVGTTTFGKGLVQQTIPFHDGSALKVTIAKYYTPSGEYIHSKGITPDVIVEREESKEGKSGKNEKMDNQLQKAWEVVREKIK